MQFSKVANFYRQRIETTQRIKSFFSVGLFLSVGEFLNLFGCGFVRVGSDFAHIWPVAESNRFSQAIQL